MRWRPAVRLLPFAAIGTERALQVFGWLPACRLPARRPG